MSRHWKNDNLREIRRGSREEEIKNIMVFFRVSDPDPDPQDPHVFALPGSGQKGKEMNE